MDDGHLNTAINKYLFSIITTYRKFVKETKKVKKMKTFSFLIDSKSTMINECA